MIKQLENHPKQEVQAWAKRLSKALESERKKAAVETEEWEWGIH